MVTALIVLAIIIVAFGIFGFFKIGDFELTFKKYVDMDLWNYRIDIVIILLLAIFLLLLAILWKLNPLW